MNREEFEAEYAGRSGVSVERLHEWGRRAEPCDCGDDLCVGWQMAHEEPMIFFAPDGRAFANLGDKFRYMTGR